MISLNSTGWLGSAGSFFGSTWCLLRLHLAAFSWELGWGWNIHEDFTLWLSWDGGNGWGAGGASLSPAGFPLSHDDFIQSFISCRDVWLFAPNLSSSVKFRFHTTTEVTILKSKCFHVLNTTTSFLELAAALCSYFYQSLNIRHYHPCVYMSRKDSLIPLSQGLTLPDQQQLFNTYLKNEWVTIKPYLTYILDKKLLLFLSLTMKRDILCPNTTKA